MNLFVSISIRSNRKDPLLSSILKHTTGIPEHAEQGCLVTPINFWPLNAVIGLFRGLNRLPEDTVPHYKSTLDVAKIYEKR